MSDIPAHFKVSRLLHTTSICCGWFSLTPSRERLYRHPVSPGRKVRTFCQVRPTPYINRHSTYLCYTFHSLIVGCSVVAESVYR